MSPSLKFLLFLLALSTTLILFKLSQDEECMHIKFCIGTSSAPDVSSYDYIKNVILMR